MSRALAILLFLAAAVSSLPARPSSGAELPSIDDPLRTGMQAAGDYGVVIGIESYPFLTGMNVAYAYRDAEAFETFLIYTLGVPPDRVDLLRGGSRGQIEAALRDAGSATGPDDTVWVYFTGHGAASAADDERLLLGDTVKQDAKLFESGGVRLDTAQELAGTGGARVVLVVDACYTGVGREGQALAPGAKYVPHSAVRVQRGATVWSAASENDVAGPYEPSGHSAFTYFAVGALRGWADGEIDDARDGRITAAEANQYVARALRTVGIRSQTPSLHGGDDEVLVRAERMEEGPDLMALRASTAPPSHASDAGPAFVAPDDLGTTEFEIGDDTDIVALAEQAARQKREREALEQREADLERQRIEEAEQQRREQAAAALELERERKELERREREVQQALEADRQRRRDEAEAEISVVAQRDWVALADLREEASPETVPVVEAFIAKYGDSTVQVDGQSYPVELALVDEAREWLRKHGVAGGVGGSVIDQHGYEMVRIEPGEFWMGSPSDEEGRDDDETRHKVRITKAFVMGATEVTQALYQAVMGENPSISEYKGLSLAGPEKPVQNVSWLDVVAFCNRLSEQEGLAPAYRISGDTVTWDRSASGYRLPTEAEWEYAARAGTADRYSGTDDASSVCGYGNVANPTAKAQFGWRESFSCEDGSKVASDAGALRANGWGLYDMTGNVREWVWDWKGAYPSGTATDPVGPSTGSSRVSRGGSWNDGPRRARVANRVWYDPGSRFNNLGFRLARSR